MGVRGVSVCVCVPTITTPDAAAEMGWSAGTNGRSSGEPAMLVDITTALENMSLTSGKGSDVTASVEQIEVA